MEAHSSLSGNQCSVGCLSDGRHRAEIVHVTMCSCILCNVTPKHTLHLHEDKFDGWLFARLSLFSGSHFRCLCCKHHSCHLQDGGGGGGGGICITIVSCNCKLLFAASATVNWPLMNLTQHCSAAALSQIFLIVFGAVGVSLTLALSRRPVSLTPLRWPHTASVLRRPCAPCASVHVQIHKQDLSVCSSVWLENLLSKAQKHRLKKTGPGSGAASGEKLQFQDFKWKLFQTGVASAFTLESES